MKNKWYLAKDFGWYKNENPVGFKIVFFEHYCDIHDTKIITLFQISIWKFTFAIYLST